MMDIISQIIANPTMAVIIMGAMTVIGLLVWLLTRRQPAQAVPDEQRRQLSGMSWTIAATHRAVSQIIGLEMSSANLAAVLLSVICAVAGTAIIVWRQYQNVFLTFVAGFATLVL